MPPTPTHSDDVLVWVIVVLTGLVFSCLGCMAYLLKQKSSNGKGGWDLSADSWELKIRTMVKEENEPTFREAHLMRGHMRALTLAIHSHNRDFIDEVCAAVRKTIDDEKV